MDYVKGLDRYLVTPAQRAAYRSYGEGRNFFVDVFLLLVLGFFGQIVLTLLLSVGIGVWAGLANNGAIPDLSGSPGVILSLLCTAGPVIVILVGARRRLPSVGVQKPFSREYLIGLLAGLGVFTAAVLICVVTGALVINSVSLTFSPLPWLLIFVCFLIQGFSEELMCRGLLMLGLARRLPVWAAVLLNALLFSALHLGNDGVAPLALVNLTLFGLFASLYFLWRGNIWGVAAFHSIWNFTQGNIFGILVSGGGSGTSLLSSTAPASGALLNGGDFGLEGGLAVTAVLVLAIAFVVWRNIDRIAKTPMPLDDAPRP